MKPTIFMKSPKKIGLHIKRLDHISEKNNYRLKILLSIFLQVQDYD
jgi:hypothetical protein